jgi:hypothetical protein
MNIGDRVRVETYKSGKIVDGKFVGIGPSRVWYGTYEGPFVRDLSSNIRNESGELYEVADECFKLAE